LLERQSGDPDKPRILGTFNEPIEDWLSFFCFTFFTDRDGKFQLLSLAESGFDPLARTCRFMLTEEAHHMFVGDTGIGRVIKRALEAMAELGTDDPARLRAHGVVDLALLQRYVNFWFSSSLDLFGNDISTNAAGYFASGVKGRPDEQRFADHDCRDATYMVEVPADGGGIGTQEVPMRNAMNAVTRAAYIQDCEIGVKRWNRLIRRAGRDEEVRLPSPRFRRTIGPFAGLRHGPDGHAMTEAEWRAAEDRFLPTAADRAHVASLMRRVTAPGKMAGWIAPPDRGINAMPVDHEYVRL
jgi:benzoyl-CoA 2,3-dioxygenase component B